MITYDQLHELLDYNLDTGAFRWKADGRGGNRIGGQEAGCIENNGYVRIMVDGVRYLAHRLAWLYVYGYMPENQIDHINRIRNANWISNLREVSQSCNTRNAKTRYDNTSGVRGVSWYKPGGKWYAQINVNSRVRNLGYYDDFDDAVCARLAAEQCLNWEGCDSTSDAFCYVHDPLAA